MAESAVPAGRASDADRDRVVRLLRDAVADGRLSHDSFVQRVDLALRAKDHASLADLIGDLAQSGGVAIGLLSGWTASIARFRGKQPTDSTLRLPDRSSPVLIVGRRADCDVVLADTTVSRVHAVLMLFGGEWLLHDRQSTNGTRVNGRRMWGATAVRPGDRVSFGRLTFRLAMPVSRQADVRE